MTDLKRDVSARTRRRRSPRPPPSNFRSPSRHSRAPRSPSDCHSRWTARRFKLPRSSGRARQPDPQVRCRVGTLRASYSATIIGQHDPAPVTESTCRPICGPAATPRPTSSSVSPPPSSVTTPTRAELLEKVSSWVGTRLDYVPGSSDPIDGAVDTLLAGAGVCRDYAHLVVALLRAVNVPARLVAVYAPGCQPMDFHAVAEAYVDGVVAGGGRHVSGAAADDGAHRHRTRRGRHRVPGQPQGGDHAEQLHGHRGRRR